MHHFLEKIPGSAPAYVLKLCQKFVECYENIIIFFHLYCVIKM
jgi:hypothetical protein